MEEVVPAIQLEIDRAHPADGPDVVGELSWTTEAELDGSGFKLVAKSRRAGQTLRSAFDRPLIDSSEFQKIIRLATGTLRSWTGSLQPASRRQGARRISADHVSSCEDPRNCE